MILKSNELGAVVAAFAFAGLQRAAYVQTQKFHGLRLAADFQVPRVNLLARVGYRPNRKMVAKHPRGALAPADVEVSAYARRKCVQRREIE